MKQEAITIESLIEIIDKQAKQIADLQQRLDYFLRQKFSSSSEKNPLNQGSLFQEEDLKIETIEDTEVEQIAYTRKKRGNKKLPPETLPHIRVVHDLKDEEKVCSCGCGLKRINEITSANTILSLHSLE